MHTPKQKKQETLDELKSRIDAWKRHHHWLKEVAARPIRRQSVPRPKGVRNPAIAREVRISEYSEMLKSQAGKCAICGGIDETRENNRRPLFVDHDHKTGEIRALLCRRCNAGLGMFQDSPIIMVRALVYLVNHNRCNDSIEESKDDARRD